MRVLSGSLTAGGGGGGPFLVEFFLSVDVFPFYQESERKFSSG